MADCKAYDSLPPQFKIGDDTDNDPVYRRDDNTVIVNFTRKTFT